MVLLLLVSCRPLAPRSGRFFRIRREEIARTARNDGMERVREKSHKLLQTDDSTSFEKSSARDAFVAPLERAAGSCVQFCTYRKPVLCYVLTGA
jgi:hypothetical protein